MGSVTKAPTAIPSSAAFPVDLAAPALQLKRVIAFVLEHDDLSEWPDAERELALLGLERRKELEALAAKLTTPSVAVRTLFLDGDITSVLLRTIQEECPDLVVVGTHGRRGFDRLFVGSTAEAIIRNAECPVMTIGPRFIPRASESPASPIVYATDFHDGSEESMAYAAFLSELHQVPLHCIHVLPKSSMDTKNHIVATIMETALADLQEASGRRALQPSSQAIFGKDVSKAIVEYAREAHASAIVLAVTRRSGLASHLPLRRTSRVVILACCPVFTLAHERHVSPLLRSTVL
jgi:nucleotide-binding universal stress UspA family protein